MSGPRLYVPLQLAAGTELELPAEAANHLRVLRLQPGQALTLFDGSGGEYPAELLALDRKRAQVRLGEHHAREAESPLVITLLQGVSKGERMDFTIQKAVELGVAAIRPVFTERSVVQLRGERLTKRIDHWQAVAAAACEQCGRNRVPPVLPALPLPQVLAATTAEQGIVLDPTGSQRLTDLPPAGSFALLIGPEGGLTDAEITAASAAGYSRLRLGPRILRTETAGLAMLAALQALRGDL